jgi:LacI family transcriptional regulator, galactose operon repressor
LTPYTLYTFTEGISRAPKIEIVPWGRVGIMVDIRELARRSGVSVATVSRALNDRAEVSPATRERIIELARELGYSPNHPARTLVRRRSDMVGLIWDTGAEIEAHDSRHPFLQDLLIGLKRALSDASYHLMLLSIAQAGARVDAYVRAAQQHSLDGVLMMAVDPDHPAITALVASQIACVGLDLPVRGPRATHVTSDNRTGAVAAVRHLHALGHRRIATITGPPHMLPAAERLAGYRYEIARLGLEYRGEYVLNGDFFLPSGYECASRLLRLAEPPTAIFAAGDEMAIGAMHAIADAGLRVPDDIAMVGFDDIEAASLVRPTLSTIVQDRRAFGVAAVAALMDTLAAPGDSGDGVVPAPRIVPTKLVVRASCGASRQSRARLES